VNSKVSPFVSISTLDSGSIRTVNRRGFFDTSIETQQFPMNSPPIFIGLALGPLGDQWRLSPDNIAVGASPGWRASFNR
jgi:hypothetical protein